MNAGYKDSDKDIYKASYTVTYEECFRVEDQFPKIIKDVVMDAIIDASYIVNLNACDEYEVSYKEFMDIIVQA